MEKKRKNTEKSTTKVTATKGKYLINKQLLKSAIPNISESTHEDGLNVVDLRGVMIEVDKYKYFNLQDKKSVTIQFNSPRVIKVGS